MNAFGSKVATTRVVAWKSLSEWFLRVVPPTPFSDRRALCWAAHSACSSLLLSLLFAEVKPSGATYHIFVISMTIRDKDDIAVAWDRATCSADRQDGEVVQVCFYAASEALMLLGWLACRQLRRGLMFVTWTTTLGLASTPGRSSRQCSQGQQKRRSCIMDCREGTRVHTLHDRPPQRPRKL